MATQKRRPVADKMRLAPVPRGSDPGKHEALWGVINDMRDRVARLEGKTAVSLYIVSGTFLGVLGLLLARVFG